MKINISDELEPKARAFLMAYLPIIYALKRTDFNIEQAAKWLGRSTKYVREKVTGNAGLMIYVTNKKPKKLKKYREDFVCRKDPQRHERERRIEAFVKGLDYLQMSEVKRQEIIDNIKKAYS